MSQDEMATLLPPEQPFWAILEIMGHIRLGGRCSFVHKGSCTLLFVEIPHSDETWTERYYNPALAIFSITICSELEARLVASGSIDTKILQPYEQKLKEKLLVTLEAVPCWKKAFTNLYNEYQDYNDDIPF